MSARPLPRLSRVAAHQAGIALLLTGAAYVGGRYVPGELNCAAYSVVAVLVVATAFASIRATWLRAVQCSTIAGTTWVLWPTLGTAPGEPVIGWLGALASGGGYVIAGVVAVAVLNAVVRGRRVASSRGAGSYTADRAPELPRVRTLSSTYLRVPYSEKDAAKAAGARWDEGRRQWYVPAGRDIAPFQRWLPN